MKSAIELSKMIRAKKKAMQADPDVVDLSGIPMDKTDEDLMEQNSMTTELGLDTNHPKDSAPMNDTPSAHELVSAAETRADEAIPNEARRMRARRLLAR